MQRYHTHHYQRRYQNQHPWMTPVSCNLQYTPQQNFVCCIQICVHLRLIDILEMVFDNTSSVLRTIAYTWTIIIYLMR